MKPYKIQITSQEPIVLINGFRILNWRRLFMVWTNLLAMIRTIKKHNGCFESFPCLISPLRVVMITYWYNEKEMIDYYRSREHVRFMLFIKNHPSSVALFNEKVSS